MMPPDHWPARMMAIDILEDAGFSTFEAEDANVALRQLLEPPEIGLVFTDINMPGKVDGLQLARLVNEARPDVRLIVTSGRERPDAAEIPDHGRFLPKPYTSQGMLGMIAAM